MTPTSSDALTACLIQVHTVYGLPISQICSPFQSDGGEMLPQPAHVSGICKRYSTGRDSLCLTQCRLFLFRRPATPALLLPVPVAPLLQGMQHNERRIECAPVLAVQRKVLKGKKQHFVQAPAGIPERLDQQPFALVTIGVEQ